MATFTKYYSLIATIALVILIFLFRECKHTVTNTVISYKTKVKDSLIYDTTKIGIPYPVLMTGTTLHDTIPKNLTQTQIDSIVKNYYSESFWARTFETKDIKITVFDTTQHNQLGKGSITYQKLIPDTLKIITNTIPQNKFKLFVGGLIGGNTTQLSELAPFIAITTKQDHYYMGGYNLLGHDVFIGTAWKIKL